MDFPYVNRGLQTPKAIGEILELVKFILLNEAYFLRCSVQLLMSSHRGNPSGFPLCEPILAPLRLVHIGEILWDFPYVNPSLHHWFT